MQTKLQEHEQEQWCAVWARKARLIEGVHLVYEFHLR